MTTNLDVLYRYELHPTEAAMIALGKARGVYGIRKIVLDEKQKTMRVEFDFTRLNRSVVMELLRSCRHRHRRRSPAGSPAGARSRARGALAAEVSRLAGSPAGRRISRQSSTEVLRRHSH